MREYFVYWSPMAQESYFNILKSILGKWSVKEAEDFDCKVNDLIEKLKQHKNLCPPSRKNRKLRRCVITSQTSLIYQFRNKTIELVTFIDNRSDHSY